MDSYDRILLYGVLVTAKASKLDIIILVLALKCYKMVTSYDLTDVFISTMRISRIDECEIAHSCFPLLDHFIPKYIAIHMNSGRLEEVGCESLHLSSPQAMAKSI